MTKQVKIYHNPRCSKSRETLNLLKENGVEPEVVLYLETPADAATLRDLLKMLGMKLPGKNLPEMTMRQKRRIRLPERMSLSSRTSLGRHTLLTSIKER